MSDAETTPVTTRKASPKASLKARRKRQKAWRAKRKRRFEEALALLNQIGDDDRIVIAPPEHD